MPSPARLPPRPSRKRQRIALAGALALALVTHGRAADPPTQVGRIVRLADGRAMNLVCSGRGAPTVVLESGFGAGAFAWDRMQPLVARQTRVCSYDRPGYGLSDPGPMPRDGAAIARDLDATLRKAGESGPFVVVGHSAGGLYARLFAARRRSDAVGLVLVDPSVPFQDRRMAAVLGPGASSLDGVRRRPAGCLKAAMNGSKAVLDVEGCLPKEPGPVRDAALRPGGWRTQLSELDTLFSATSEQVNRTLPVLIDVPTIVLTASPTGVPAGQEDLTQATWESLHREIAKGVLRGQQRLVKSSHLIMVDRPDVVAGAVLELVAAARKSSPRR